jgi:2-(1,2-epoxy-1,2-dihydrophenyl)acetyl-CoA isomerase
MSSYGDVTLTWRESIAIVTFSRLQTMNAMSMDLVAGLQACLDEVVQARCARGLVLTAAGKGFCVGGDISVHRDRSPEALPFDLGDVLQRVFNPVLLRLVSLPMPLVVAVNGPAAGAGCPLALCGDVVIASSNAYFECGFTRLGLVPDLGATWLLPRLVGRARAHAMMLLNQRVDAAQALAWGMIHQVVAPEELQATALQAAERLAAQSVPAVVATRRAVLDAGDSSLADALHREALLQREAGYSADFAEGIAAFFAKRSPRFTDS